jgi:two-component sensor histidine kinase
VQSLCLNLAEIQDSPGGGVTLTCESDSIILDLDVVTALGLVVAELVTNAYDHAFPGGEGSIGVSVRNDAGGVGTATLTVRDTGAGFKPQTESKRHGLGLVRRLIEQVRGTVILDSDRGTVWTIQFPAVSTIAAAA